MKVSFITITLNNNGGLIKTLNSYIEFKKLYSDCEIIVIDGLSHDETISTIEKYKNFINFYISEKDSGIYDAMNKGIKYVSGDFVSFMNAGDTIIADGLFSLINKITNLEFCYIGQAVWDADLASFKYLNFFPKLLRLPNHQAMLIPIGCCFNFNLSYKIASDLDQKLKIIRTNKFKIFNINVVICESGGVSQSILSLTDIYFRSIEIYNIAYSHFGLIWGLANFFKFFIWHSFNLSRKTK